MHPLGKLLFLIVCLSVLWRTNAFYRNCKYIKQASPTSPSGVYTIQPFPGTFVLMQVYCDMTTEGGGWTVIQRRGFYPTQENFFRRFDEYAIGFGNVARDHYIGNQFIYGQSIQHGYMQLRIKLADFEGHLRHVKYNHFRINSYADGYRLRIYNYNAAVSSAPDSLLYHHNYRFSTYDRDYDAASINCALTYRGAWWYRSCHQSNLNGLYLAGYHPVYARGVNWLSWRGYHYSHKFTEMMIRHY